MRNARSTAGIRQHWWLAALLVLVFAAGALLLWRYGLVQRLSNKTYLIESLRNAGVSGPLLCIGIQFIQVMIFVIPGEITQFAAGYVFGIWRGFLYSIVGIVAGSAFNFYFARLVGRPVLARLTGQATVDKVDKLLNNARGKSAVFLLFLIPGTPKDAMCYGAGLSNLNLLEFLVISGLGRSPALFSSILLGAQASRRDYRAMLLTALIAGVALAAYYLYERRRNRNRLRRP